MSPQREQQSPWAAAAVALATVAVCVSVVPLGFDRDDASVWRAVWHTGYGEIWVTPFRELYYRPVVLTLVKLSSDLFGTSPLPLRLL